jgi:glycosyltransferase involved in cell wall biosynthesis
MYAVLADPRGRVPIAYRKIGRAIGSRGERLLARFMARAAVVFAVSDGLADELEDRFFVERARIRVIPTARRAPRRLQGAERAAFRASFGAKPDVPLITWAGRLIPDKQPGAALQAYALIRSRFGACTLALCGDGPLRPSVERAAAAAGDGALVLGNRDDSDRLIAAADVLLSTSEAEAAPGVLVEAGLAGVPVAAFDVGEVSQIVRDGETGVLAPPGFIEVLAVLVVDLLRTPERREAMGAAARKACARFSVEAVVAEYATAFAEAARGPEHRPGG